MTAGINVRSAPVVDPANRIGGVRYGSAVNILGDVPGAPGWVQIQGINSDNGQLFTGIACNTCAENTDGVPYFQ